MFNSLSGRFINGCVCSTAEVLIFVPSTRFRSDFLMAIGSGQIASLVLLADDMISTEFERELFIEYML